MSQTSHIPLRSSGNAPSPNLSHTVHFQNPFPSSHCFPITKPVLTCNVSEQMCYDQVSVSASVSTFPSRYHMCSRGNNTVLCCSLYGRGNVLEAGSVCNCTAVEKTEKKGSESQCVRGFEGWSQRPYFGLPDESPGGCGHTVCLVHQLMFLHHISHQHGALKNSQNCSADCGMLSLCVQVNLINQALKSTLDGDLPINIESLPKLWNCRKTARKIVFCVLAIFFSYEFLFLIKIIYLKKSKFTCRIFLNYGLSFR